MLLESQPVLSGNYNCWTLNSWLWSSLVLLDASYLNSISVAQFLYLFVGGTPVPAHVRLDSHNQWFLVGLSSATVAFVFSYWGRKAGRRFNHSLLLSYHYESDDSESCNPHFSTSSCVFFWPCRYTRCHGYSMILDAALQVIKCWGLVVVDLPLIWGGDKKPWIFYLLVFAVLFG